MSSKRPFSLERLFRKIHSWLGIIVLPLIVIIGLTGIYLNHGRQIYRLLPNGSYDEAQFDQWPSPHPVDRDAARAIADIYWPDEGIKSTKEKKYNKRKSFEFKKDSGRIIVVKATGHYWVRTAFTRITYDPDHNALTKKIYWGRIFKTLHTRGWVDRTFGTWLADITGAAMVIFGLSGLYMFFAPRFRRLSNRRARLRVQPSNAPPRPNPVPAGK